MVDYIWKYNVFLLCHCNVLCVLGKLLSGEEEGLEDDPERAEVTTGSFSGKSWLCFANDFIVVFTLMFYIFK